MLCKCATKKDNIKYLTTEKSKFCQVHNIYFIILMFILYYADKVKVIMKY